MSHGLETQDIATRAIQDGPFAAAVLDGSDHSRVREAILQDLFDAPESAQFPIRLTQHPYRPGISGDLQRRFEPAAWERHPKTHLSRLAAET